jgi:hypothetical protein
MQDLPAHALPRSTGAKCAAHSVAHHYRVRSAKLAGIKGVGRSTSSRTNRTNKTPRGPPEVAEDGDREERS